MAALINNAKTFAKHKTLLTALKESYESLKGVNLPPQIPFLGSINWRAAVKVLK